jgi:arsenate reductase (thioredoxin)
VTKNVLFLCTGNSVRSIMAESLLNHWGKGQFVGYSAGSFPKTAVHPLALTVLNERLLPTAGLRSKNWDEFARPDAPAMDYIFTVCDNAAGEVSPVWPGHPVTAHWNLPDPAAVVGTQTARTSAFRDTARALEGRIRVFLKT